MNINQFQQNTKIETMMNNSFLTAFKMYLNNFDRLLDVRVECLDYLTKYKKTLKPFAVLMLDYLETFIKNNDDEMLSKKSDSNIIQNTYCQNCKIKIPYIGSEPLYIGTKNGKFKRTLNI